MNPIGEAERVARESYGRLLALLAARTRDIAAAEDALSDAFAAALTAWPRVGAPENPEAWLMAAAKRKMIDTMRRKRGALAAHDEMLRHVSSFAEAVEDAPAPERRLGLMFACAHPVIDDNARTALMLQTVLGFSAERMAPAFLVSPSAMSQRLVRAKKKIRDAGVSFEIPDAEQYPARSAAVLEAIYAAYGAGWSDPLGADPEQNELAEEAIWLGRLLVQEAPSDAEALGLLALMLHLQARKPARRVEGRFAPLDQQDVALWRMELIREAEFLLASAARASKPGRFQYEAAIQSAHAARAYGRETDWDAIVLLYEALARETDSAVALLNRAAALARRDGAEAGVKALEAIDAPALKSYQPYWALRADLFAKLGRNSEARAAYDEAIARERDAAVIAFLSERRNALA